jgi:hypothetical protein
MKNLDTHLYSRFSRKQYRWNNQMEYGIDQNKGPETST